MAKTVAAAGRYPYGICGFVVQKAVLKDGTVISDARIYKQRNSYDYDVIDSNGVKHSSLRITGSDLNGSSLNYNEDDTVLQTRLKPGHFYVRAMSENTESGFGIKFFDNKVILSDGRQLHNLIPPTCGVPKGPLGSIVCNTLHEGDTVISGTISPHTGTTLNETNMQIEFIIDGITYKGAVHNLAFSITVPALNAGSIDISCTSDFYQTAYTTVNVISQEDILVHFFIPKNDFVDTGTGSLSADIDLGTNNIKDFIVETQTQDGSITTVQTDYNPSTGIMTFTLYEAVDLNIVIIPDSTENPFYVESITDKDWVKNGENYAYALPAYSTHKPNYVIAQIMELNNNVLSLVHADVTEYHANIILTCLEPFSAKITVTGG